MLSDAFSRIGAGTALLVVILAGGATYLALNAAAGGDSRAPAPVKRETERSVGGVSVDADGKLTYSGALNGPASRKRHARSAAPTASQPQTTAAQSGSQAASITRAVGQMIVTPLAGQAADGALLARIRSGAVGGVILFGQNIRTVPQVQSLVGSLQDAARAGGNPGLLVMTDQEGGTVKRFLSAPPFQSATELGAHPPAAIQRVGLETAQALRERGVNVDLAPVADVPPTASTFLTTRAFGHDSATVSNGACSFAAGLTTGGIGATLKHFPGLGHATGNTDSGAVVVPGVSDSELQPYRRCANAHRTLVMISNAAYSTTTGNTPAVLSTNTYALLRSRLGYQGPTISDSLDAGALAGQADIATRAAGAGLDLQLWTTATGANSAYEELLGAVRAGAVPAARVRTAARRIHDLKAMLGLL